MQLFFTFILLKSAISRNDAINLRCKLIVFNIPSVIIFNQLAEPNKTNMNNKNILKRTRTRN
jgi:hypothetical protein